MNVLTKFSRVCVLVLLAFCGCAKYGDMNIDPSQLRGMYRAVNSYRIKVDGSNRILEKDGYGNSPAWPGVIVQYYSFDNDATIVGFTCYKFYEEPYSGKNTLCWALRQTEEQYSKNVFKYDSGSRSVETNLWKEEGEYMKVYSADSEEIQLWARIYGRKGRWYNVFQLMKVSDDKILTLLNNADEYSEENEEMILDVIYELWGKERK